MGYLHVLLATQYPPKPKNNFVVSIKRKMLKLVALELSRQSLLLPKLELCDVLMETIMHCNNYSVFVMKRFLVLLSIVMSSTLLY